MQYIY